MRQPPGGPELGESNLGTLPPIIGLGRVDQEEPGMRRGRPWRSLTRVTTRVATPGARGRWPASSPPSTAPRPRSGLQDFSRGGRRVGAGGVRLTGPGRETPPGGSRNLGYPGGVEFHRNIFRPGRFPGRSVSANFGKIPGETRGLTADNAVKRLVKRWRNLRNLLGGGRRRTPKNVPGTRRRRSPTISPVPPAARGG